MRVIKAVLIILFLLVVLAGAGVVVFLKTVDLNQYKDRITQTLTEQLHRPVQLGRINLVVSWRDGILFEVRDLAVQDDPAFSQRDLLAVQQAILKVDLAALLTKQQLLVSQIHLVSPRISVVRNAANVLNVQALAAEASPAGATPPAARPPEDAGAAGAAAPPMDLGALQIKSIQIQDGQVFYTDAAQDPVLNLDVSQITLEISDFNLTTPFPFELNLAVLSERPNIRLQGKVQVDANKGAVRLRDTEARLDLSTISLDRLRQVVPALAGLDLGAGFAGMARLSVEQLAADASGLTALVAQADLTQGQIALPYQGLVLKDLFIQTHISPETVVLDDMKADLGGRTIRINGRLEDYLGSQTYTLKVNAADLELAPLLPAFDPAIHIEGGLSMDGQFSGQGLAPDTFLANLKGTGSVTVRDGRVVNMNILKVVLDRITLLPGLADRISAALPQKYQEALLRNDTIVRQAETIFQLAGGVVTLDPVQVAAQEFSLNARAVVTIPADLRLEAELFISKDLAAQMIKGVPELGPLQEGDGRVRIPLQTYDGPVAGLQVWPDMTYLGKRILLGTGQNELRKVLDKALGRDGQPAATEDGTAPAGSPENPASTTEGPTPAQSEKPLEQQLIEGVLDSIFR